MPCRARRVPTSITDQFWQYAKEAMLAACSAETEEDRRGLFELAGTWAQAALLEASVRQLPRHQPLVTGLQTGHTVRRGLRLARMSHGALAASLHFFQISKQSASPLRRISLLRGAHSG
jgi:hypothetical protein